MRHEFRANAGDLIYSFLVLDEVDIRHHGHHVGSYEVRDNRPDLRRRGRIYTPRPVTIRPPSDGIQINDQLPPN